MSNGTSKCERTADIIEKSRCQKLMSGYSQCHFVTPIMSANLTLFRDISKFFAVNIMRQNNKFHKV